MSGAIYIALCMHTVFRMSITYLSELLHVPQEAGDGNTSVGLLVTFFRCGVVLLIIPLCVTQWLNFLVLASNVLVTFDILWLFVTLTLMCLTGIRYPDIIHIVRFSTFPDSLIIFWVHDVAWLQTSHEVFWLEHLSIDYFTWTIKNECIIFWLSFKIGQLN